MRKKNKLNAVVDSVYESMLTTEDNEEFQEQLQTVERLEALNNRKSKLSKDTLAIVIGNIVVVMIVVVYENRNVLTTKAFGLTLKANQNQTK